MRKHLTEIVSFVTLMAFVLGGYVFMDTKHAQAADLERFKVEVARMRSEDNLEEQYNRLETAEDNLESDPDNPLKRRMVATLMRNVEYYLAKADRDAGVQ